MNAKSDFLQLWTKLNLAKSYNFNNFADSGSKDKGRGRSLVATKVMGAKMMKERMFYLFLFTPPKLHSYQSLLLQINYFSPLRKAINRTKINVMLFCESSF